MSALAMKAAVDPVAAWVLNQPSLCQSTAAGASTQSWR